MLLTEKSCFVYKSLLSVTVFGSHLRLEGTHTPTPKLVFACQPCTSYCPSFVDNLFLATAPIGFVHVFQLWTFPEPWTLLSSFV